MCDESPNQLTLSQGVYHTAFTREDAISMKLMVLLAPHYSHEVHEHQQYQYHESYQY